MSRQPERNPSTTTAQPQPQQRRSSRNIPPPVSSHVDNDNDNNGHGVGVGLIPPTPPNPNPNRVTLPPIRIPDIDLGVGLGLGYPRRPGSSSSSASASYPSAHPQQQQQHQRASPSSAADPYSGLRHLPPPIPVSSPGQASFLPTHNNGHAGYFLPLSSSSSSPLSIDGRILRSPHPPLTALLNPTQAQAQAHQQQQQYQHQYLQQQQQQSHFLAQQQQQQHLLHPAAHLHRPYHTLSPLVSPSLPSGSAVTAPPYLPPPASASSSSSHSHSRRASPVLIPPPLRFHYSATPPAPSPQQQHYLSAASASAHLPVSRPGSAASANSDPALRSQYFPQFLIPAMPPRRKAPAGAGAAATGANDHGMTGTPQTVSSATSSTRPRKAAKGNGWTMEHTYDSVGQKKEVIVIDDSQTPEHPPRKRTRAQVAAENAAAAAGAGAGAGTSAQGYAQPQPYGRTSVNGPNGHHLSNGHAAASVPSTSSAGKKRKVDDGSDAAAKKKGKASGTAASQQTLPKGPAIQPVPPSNQPNTWDDAEGHYIVRPDDIIGSKYKIVRLLGQGTFGKVVEARHIESRRKVAIKVIRAVQKYRDASKIEIRVLETLRRNDPTNSFCCIHLDEYFDYRNHPCIVSELYGMSVFDFLKQNSFSPFPERHIQDFARSLLKSVDFLHRLRLVHTDLKPENILLVSNEARLAGPRRAGAKSRAILRNTDIRLIDFGSATFENEYHSSVVSTRHYRAPEIILGMSWSYPCDMFSIGCILVEFFTGDALFQTHDNLEHLAMMEVVMGRMPARMVEKGRLKKGEFFKGGKIDFPNSNISRSSRKYVKGMKSLAQIIPPTTTHNKLFLDLIERLLDFDPDTRLTVDKALDHPYLRTPTSEPFPTETQT